MPQQVPDKIGQPKIEDIIKNHISDNIPPMKLEKVELLPEVKLDVSVNVFERVSLFLNQNGTRILGIVGKVLELTIGGSASGILAIVNLILVPFGKVVTQEEIMGDSNVSTLDAIKGFVVPMIGRWVLKIGGGYLLAHGISENSTLEVVGAVVSMLVGVVVSLINQKKAIATPPPVS